MYGIGIMNGTCLQEFHIRFQNTFYGRDRFLKAIADNCGRLKILKLRDEASPLIPRDLLFIISHCKQLEVFETLSSGEVTQMQRAKGTRRKLCEANPHVLLMQNALT
jgi:hypothetical protein